MHVMFAEDIGGWLAAGLFLFGGLGASALALVAIIPARKGKGVFTALLVLPAVAMAIIATYWLGQAFFEGGSHEEDATMGDFIEPWLLMGFPSFFTSLLAGAVFFIKKRTGKTQTSPG